MERPNSVVRLSCTVVFILSLIKVGVVEIFLEDECCHKLSLSIGLLFRLL